MTTAAVSHSQRLSLLAGRAVIVAGGSTTLGRRISTGLTELGASVGEVGTLTTREEAIEAVSTTAAERGGLDAVVHVAGIEAPLKTRLLVETDEESWDREAEAPIRAALVLYQAAFTSLSGRGGSIVSVIPSIAITGAAGLVPFASAAEGIRLLMKSAARAWGEQGIRVNCVTAPIEQWEVEQREDELVPNRFGASLPPADPETDVAGAVAFLVSELGKGVTGATIGVDRGTVMAP